MILSKKLDKGSIEKQLAELEALADVSENKKISNVFEKNFILNFLI